MAELRKCRIDGCQGKYSCRNYYHRHYCQVIKYGAVYETTNDARPAIIEGDTAKIPLGVGAKNGYIIVDKEDASIAGHKWFLVTGGYASATIGGKKGKQTLLHRFIMSPSPHKEVDHINGNKLDNRRSNLRICTRGENSRNMGPHMSRNKSGYKGVRNRTKNSWEAQIHHGRDIRVGYFRTAVEAAKAYDRAAIKYFGEFAWLNFPEENYNA